MGIMYWGQYLLVIEIMYWGQYLLVIEIMYWGQDNLMICPFNSIRSRSFQKKFDKGMIVNRQRASGLHYICIYFVKIVISALL